MWAAELTVKVCTVGYTKIHCNNLHELSGLPSLKKILKQQISSFFSFQKHAVHGDKKKYTKITVAYNKSPCLCAGLYNIMLECLGLSSQAHRLSNLVKCSVIM